MATANIKGAPSRTGCAPFLLLRSSNDWWVVPPLVNKPILILPNNQQSHKYEVYTDIFCWLVANFTDLSWLPCFCPSYRAKWLRLQGWRYFTLNNVMNKMASPATMIVLATWW